MASRAVTALAALSIVVLALAAAVATGALPSPFAPAPIEETPEPFTDAPTTAPPNGPSTSGPSATDGGAPTPTGVSPVTAGRSADATPETSAAARGSAAGATATDDAPATTVAATTATVRTTTTASGTVVANGTPADRRYDRATVTIAAENGTQLATVGTWLADTQRKRYTGLSNVESLPNGTGMLFVYDEERDLTYVMRRMDFALDIVFVGADGRINAIESAPAPGPNEDGNDIRRSGRGQYVLEVPRGWMASQGIEVGDRVRIDRDANATGTS
jgi:uncharacterized membrane protein (UPF0127 family)